MSPPATWPPRSPGQTPPASIRWRSVPTAAHWQPAPPTEPPPCGTSPDRPRRYSRRGLAERLGRPVRQDRGQGGPAGEQALAAAARPGGRAMVPLIIAPGGLDEPRVRQQLGQVLRGRPGVVEVARTAAEDQGR